MTPLTLSAPQPTPDASPLTLEPEPKVSPRKRDDAPLTLASADEGPLTLTAQPDEADGPLVLGTPLPDKKSPLSCDALMLDEPLDAEPELQLAGLELEPQTEVINLTEPVRKPSPVPPAEKDSIPDLFGDPRPAPQSGPRSLLDEAASLAPCEQGSHPAQLGDELAVDDIVELGAPVAPAAQTAAEEDASIPGHQEEAPSSTLPLTEEEEATAQEQAAPADDAAEQERPPLEEKEEGRLQDAEQDSEAEASDEAIRSLLEELDAALERAVQGDQAGDAQMVCEAAAHIGRLAETYDLRVLDDPARCLEEVACSGNTAEIAQLMPDLISAINRNRASFEEGERDA